MTLFINILIKTKTRQLIQSYRGLGRSISIALAQEVGDESAFLLLSRTERDLEETKRNLMDNFEWKKLQVTVKSVDNESADRKIYESCFKEALREEDAKK